MKLESNKDTSLRIARRYAAPPAKLFEAWTRPEVMGRWLAPSPDMTCDATTDVRVGGRYRIDMKSPDGTHHIAVGVYEEIVPNERLVFTWSWEANPGHGENTIVTIDLKAAGDQTDLTLTHERFVSSEQRDSHEKGWSAIAARLEELFADQR
jgi:uncharacterized protein YndB with AHSA1/START domain